MYGKQVKKSEKGDSTPIVFYRIDKIKKSYTIDELKLKDELNFLSIDPGTKNLAIRFEKRFKDAKQKPILFEKLNKKYEVKEGDNIEVEFFDELVDYMDKKLDIVLDLDVIIVERQPIVNYRTARIMQHFLTYFNIVFKNSSREILPLMVDIRPELRRKWLKFQKNLNKVGIDNETKKIGRMLLEKQNDDKSISVLNATGAKTDDLCVTVCQIETFLLFYGFFEHVTDKSYLPPEKKSKKSSAATQKKRKSAAPKKKNIKYKIDDVDEI